MELRMSDLELFKAYAAAFEETYIDNNWQRLAQYFTADAVYAPGDGSEAVGRDQVLAQLREGVDGLDRLFDSRALIASPPSAEGDTVSLTWKLTLSKAGAPDLTVAGAEHATYTAGAISHLEDIFDKGTAESLGGWMAKHEALLDD
ncbi:MAG: hypothetical protein ACI82A_002448 [Candidatus Azotimanducaceae bacterium]|jgi:hypothetical protein